MGKRGGGLTNRVRELRDDAGMTQQQLADRVGVTRQTVIAIERNKYSPSLEVAFRVALALGVPINDAFAYTDPSLTGTGRSTTRGMPVSSRLAADRIFT